MKTLRLLFATLAGGSSQESSSAGRRLRFFDEMLSGFDGVLLRVSSNEDSSDSTNLRRFHLFEVEILHGVAFGEDLSNSSDSSSSPRIWGLQLFFVA